MEMLLAGCAGFIAIHLGISGTPLRGVLINALGNQPYLGVFSALTLATFGLMVYGYSDVAAAEYLWHHCHSLENEIFFAGRNNTKQKIRGNFLGDWRAIGWINAKFVQHSHKFHQRHRWISILAVGEMKAPIE